MASCSLNTEAMDYARFLLALMDGKGLRPGTLAEMLRPQATDGESRPPRTWGLGLEVRMGPGGARYLHSGSNRNFTSQFVLIPSRKFGYVFLIRPRVRAFGLEPALSGSAGSLNASSPARRSSARSSFPRLRRREV